MQIEYYPTVSNPMSAQDQNHLIFSILPKVYLVKIFMKFIQISYFVWECLYFSSMEGMPFMKLGCGILGVPP